MSASDPEKGRDPVILTIDIGNSTITVGAFEKGALSFRASLETAPDKTSDRYAIDLLGVFQLYGAEIQAVEGGIISSVVPPVTGNVASAIARLTGKRPLVVGPGIKTGLNIRAEAHDQLGSDIVANCVAAIARYPTPVIVIDMGTATTMTLINGTTFEGCTLMPGARIALDALFSQTAQLPNISMESPTVGVLARNTVDAMRSGILHGHASMVDGMIARITEEYMPVSAVIATGGNAPFVLHYCRKDITYDANLLLDGLYLLYQKNAEKNQKAR